MTFKCILMSLPFLLVDNEIQYYSYSLFLWEFTYILIKNHNAFLGIIIKSGYSI